MKTAAKVFIVIGMIFTFYLIFPIVLGVLAIKKIDSATSSSELLGWAIATIFLVSTLGGIFMLFIKDEDLKENAPAKEAEPARAEEPAPAEEPTPAEIEEPAEKSEQEENE